MFSLVRASLLFSLPEVLSLTQLTQMLGVSKSVISLDVSGLVGLPTLCSQGLILLFVVSIILMSICLIPVFS